MNVTDHVKEVRERIGRAALQAGRRPEDITLVAVTKTVDAETARKVLGAGVKDLGENRVQSFLDKYEALGDAPNWHLIGHLQTNKVKYVVGKVGLIHSVDSLYLAEEINKRAKALGIRQEVLIQINISGEQSKSGVEPEAVSALFEQLSGLECISIRGLMTMAPLESTCLENRRIFAGLKELSEKIARQKYPGVSMDYLSMGMSGDFEEAIYEGANLVRIGSALFA